jgi:hypothetical protein
MDIYEIIRILHEERQRLDRMILRIQELQKPRRGSRKHRAGGKLTAKRASAVRRRRSGTSA